MSPSTSSPSTVPVMSIVAYASSMSGYSESSRLANRSRSASTCWSTAVVGDRFVRQLDGQLVVAEELHLRPHFDDRVELDVAVFFAGGDLDLRRRDHIDVVRLDGLDVVLGQRVAQRLFPRRFGPKRASSNWRGALPGRKPGTRTSRASFLNAPSMARSNSSAGTVTCSLTLFPSSVSTVLSIRKKECSDGSAAVPVPGVGSREWRR